MTTRPYILVVDDDAPTLILMRNVLREFGFDSVTVATGAEAIAEARKRQPDLVLLDKHMPSMSGPDVIRALRDELHLENLPILILSGDPVAADELAKLRASGAVLKPFDLPSLIEQIRGQLAQPTLSS